MPKRKTLASVANSFAESFVGPLNYSGNDMVVAHLTMAAYRSGRNQLVVNLLDGSAEPPELMTPEVRKSIERYVHLFPDMVARSNSDIAFVKEAKLTLDLEPKIYSAGPMRGEVASPYCCRVQIVDDRGKMYESVKVGSASPEQFQVRSLFARVKRFFAR
jgi:hypothetical protein